MTVDLVQMETSTVECNWDVNSQVQSIVFSLDVKIIKRCSRGQLFLSLVATKSRTSLAKSKVIICGDK